MVIGMSAGRFFYVQMPRLADVLSCPVRTGRRQSRAFRPWLNTVGWGDRIVEAAILTGISLPYSHLHAPAVVLAATWYVNLWVFMAVGAVSVEQRFKPILWLNAASDSFSMYATLEVIIAIQRFMGRRRELRRLR